MSTTTKQGGFSLVEVLVYIVGFILVLGAIVSIIVAVYGWYGTAIVTARADRVGMAVVDQLIRGIRTGRSAIIGGNGSSLTLSAIGNGVPVTRYFVLDDGRVSSQENEGPAEYLSPSDIDVTRLIFTVITTPVSSAIRFDMDITYVVKGVSRTKTYGSLAVMRNSYQ